MKKWNLFRALVKFYTSVRCPPPMYSPPSQGIVTYMYVLPVEAGSRLLISENHSSSCDCSLELACLILQGFKGQKLSLVSEQMCWLVDISRSEFILISSLREHWSLGSILIPIANASTLGGATFSVPWLVKLLNIALKRKCLKIDCLLYYTVQNYIICARN